MRQPARNGAPRGEYLSQSEMAFSSLNILWGFGGRSALNPEEEAKPDDETKDLRRKPLYLKTSGFRATPAVVGLRA
jgi:hypothetical protein